ncbi:MAG: lytic transglycosylase domain-containing protein [Clostridia bacterium]|nr:lytic transglycosylase domain-containing protein [Clostridia bacterium]
MEKKTTGETKKNISFSIAVIGLAIVVIAPIVLFVFSALFHGKSTGEFTKAVYPVKYEYYVEKYSKEFDVDVCLIYGIIRTESGFDPDAVSQAGAIGLMQLMPDTFTWLQNYRTEFMPDKIIDSKELYKPGVNIEYGTYMLKFLLDHYNGNRSLAIIAYNAGYGNVDAWLADGIIQRDVTAETVPFKETSNYLTRVTEATDMYRTLYYSDLESQFPEINTDTFSSDEDSSDSDTSDTDTDTEEWLYEDDNEYYDDTYEEDSESDSDSESDDEEYYEEDW